MVFYDILIQGFLLLRIGVSTVSPTIFKVEALAVYFFALALLLLAVTVLFAIYWRHSVVTARRRPRTMSYQPPSSPLLDGYHERFQMRTVTPKQSLDSLANKSETSFYDNLVPNHQYHYNVKYLKNSDVV